MKVYPPNWPNRHLLPSQEDRIGLEIVEAFDLCCEKESSYTILQVKGTFRQTSKAEVRPYVIRWLIALSNCIKSPVWCWAGENNPSIQPKAHFHCVLFIPQKVENKLVERLWPYGIMTTKEYNEKQTPFNALEYIIGKHDLLPIQNPIKPSLKRG